LGRIACGTIQVEVVMRARTKNLINTDQFTLTMHRSSASKKYYSIHASLFCWENGFTEVRKHFDPAGNRGSKTGNTWKFRNKQEAEHLIAMAILRFSGK